MIIERETPKGKIDLYIDGKLYRDIQTKIKPKLLKKDFDYVIVVDGAEGAGKSLLSQQLAKAVDPSFNLSRMCMTSDEFIKAINNAKKGQAVVFDEAFTGLSSRQALSDTNKIMVSMMMEMRQKNLFVIIVMPTFFLLERYVAIFRAKGLFHVYLKNGERGRWIFFNERKKKLLYLTGKKLFSYKQPKSRYRGRFLDQYVVDEAEYREKKRKALTGKERITKSGKLMKQRNLILYVMNKRLRISQKAISKYCFEYGFDISQNRLSEIFAEIEKNKYMARE